MLKNSLKIAAIIFVVGVSVAAQAPTVVRTVKIQHDLALNSGYVSNLVTVEIPVGGREGRHKHSGTLIALVEAGELTLDHDGHPTITYKVGETFAVEPGTIHEGMNKGTTPVRLIATFVFPKDQPMTTQMPDSKPMPAK